MVLKIAKLADHPLVLKRGSFQSITCIGSAYLKKKKHHGNLIYLFTSCIGDIFKHDNMPIMKYDLTACQK